METNNNYFIINNFEKVQNGEYTNFLNQNELKKVCSLLNKNHTSYQIFYPYRDAEKVIVFKDVEPKISLLEIISKYELKHSDILGSLFGNNIKPSYYGDIIINEKKYYLIILSKLLPFFLTQFKTIGHYKIDIKELELNAIEDYSITYEVKKYLCNSLRFDNIVSVITNLSRNSVNNLFLKNEVLLNYEITRRFKKIEKGDIFSIRGYGKYKLSSVLGKSKKGKIIIEILKYN